MTDQELTGQRFFNRAYKNLRSALHDINHAIDELPAVERFHHQPNGEQCGWSVEDGEQVWDDEPDMRVITMGLEQWCRYDPDTDNASTNGWDDMGDMYGPEYIYCEVCGRAFKPGPDMDWS